MSGVQGGNRDVDSPEGREEAMSEEFREELVKARLARAAGCKRCVFFHEMPTEHPDGVRQWGSCQFGAPRATSDTRWPRVHRNAWCGQWLPLMASDEGPLAREVE